MFYLFVINWNSFLWEIRNIRAIRAFINITIAYHWHVNRHMVFGNTIKPQINVKLPNRKVFCLWRCIITLSWRVVLKLKGVWRLSGKLVYRKQIYIDGVLNFFIDVSDVLKLSHARFKVGFLSCACFREAKNWRGKLFPSTVSLAICRTQSGENSGRRRITDERYYTFNTFSASCWTSTP